MRRIAATMTVLMCAFALVSPASASEWPGDAPYSVTKDKLRAAFNCKGKGAC